MNTKLYDLLFPQLTRRVWEPINLNSFTQITHQFRPEINFLNPDQMDNWLRQVHLNLGCDYTFGGYMEERSYYLKEDKIFHLGVDFNVPFGTLVHSPIDGEVINVIYDPKDFGWGTRLTLRVHPDLYVVFGHLHPYLNVTFGEKVKRGAWLGKVAPKEHNGGWYEHLHIQLLTEWSTDFDGYASRTEDIELKYPNPKTLLGET